MVVVLLLVPVPRKKNRQIQQHTKILALAGTHPEAANQPFIIILVVQF